MESRWRSCLQRQAARVANGHRVAATLHVAVDLQHAPGIPGHDHIRSALREVLCLAFSYFGGEIGLEQVVDKSTNTRIDDLRRKALAAEQAEDWQAAADHYATVLNVDRNIQFARDGRARVAA